MATLRRLSLVIMASNFVCLCFSTNSFLDKLQTLRNEGTLLDTGTSSYFQYLDTELWESTEYKQMRYVPETVSYTHLTLPTIYSV